MKQITCDDFFDSIYDDNALRTWFSDMHWDSGIKTDAVWDDMLAKANDLGYELIDKDTWDYDHVIYNAYRNDSDKGLS